MWLLHQTDGLSLLRCCVQRCVRITIPRLSSFPRRILVGDDNGVILFRPLGIYLAKVDGICSVLVADITGDHTQNSAPPPIHHTCNCKRKQGTHVTTVALGLGTQCAKHCADSLLLALQNMAIYRTEQPPNPENGVVRGTRSHRARNPEISK